MIKRLSLSILVLSFLGLSCVPMEVDEDLKSDVEFEDLRIDFGKKAKLPEARRSIRFGDRYFVESVITNVFGDNSVVDSQSFNLIFKKQGTFGGGCDLYEENREETGAGSNQHRNPEKRQDCFDANRNTDQVGTSTVIRAGYMVKFCEYTITKNPTAVKYAFTKAKIDPKVAEISKPNFNRLYQLFYPNRTLASVDDRKINKAIYDESLSLNENWELLLLSLCVSPEWQIP